MKNDCIVIQGHIPDHMDPQGHLMPSEKAWAMSSALKHLRKNNPNSYIILTGHGFARPDNDAFDCVNEYYWEPKCRPLDSNGYVANMPGQFWFIAEGLERAAKAGFDRVVKTRLDCLIGIPNIAEHCESILQKESKLLLLTQQTGWNNKCGDCFLYGSIAILGNIFNKKSPMKQQDGLLYTGANAEWALRANYVWETNCELSDDEYNIKTWPWLLLHTCSFRDTINLKFADLRWNWVGMVQKYGNDIFNYIQSNNFDYRTYAWGSPQWHRFDQEGNMTYKYFDDLISEKEFYGK